MGLKVLGLVALLFSSNVLGNNSCANEYLGLSEIEVIYEHDKCVDDMFDNVVRYAGAKFVLKTLEKIGQKENAENLFEGLTSLVTYDTPWAQITFLGNGFFIRDENKFYFTIKVKKTGDEYHAGLQLIIPL
ncbi:MAG: hypothetical protein HRU03_02520 [Nanoarchaeales archaeon]|nr:hypothetical protein [Nanoarchaeales archaeon]